MSKKNEPPNPCAPAPKKTAPKGKEEKNVTAEKIDYCLTDALVKCALGALFGAIASSLFLRRRKWPMVAGSGIGIGAAAADCRHQIKVAKEKEEKEKDKKKK